MAKISQEVRQRVWEMFDGKCAYCEEVLKPRWQVDHVKPLFRDWGDKDPLPDHAGEDVESNMAPSCPRCNRWKSTATIEEFRAEIEAQRERLRRDSGPYRMALAYGQIQEVDKPVTFYFERCCGEE